MNTNEMKNKLAKIYKEMQVSEQINEKFNIFYENKVILGIDIYKYSKYELAAQSLIPYIFNTILLSTIEDLSRYEPLFFNNFNSNEFKKNFVNTGDGGFIILDTPLHALLFAIYLSSKFKVYNTGKLLTPEFNITKELTFRLALCSGKIYNLENNWYGPSIISCARILGADKLNRFLIDQNIKSWFEQELNGIETLLSYGLNNFENKNVFKEYFEKYNGDIDKRSLIIPKVGNDPGLINSNILNMDLLKIGDIENKNNIISVYSLHLQVYIVRVTFENVDNPDKYVISIGNLSVQGL